MVDLKARALVEEQHQQRQHLDPAVLVRCGPSSSGFRGFRGKGGKGVGGSANGARFVWGVGQVLPPGSAQSSGDGKEGHVKL